MTIGTFLDIKGGNQNLYIEAGQTIQRKETTRRSVIYKTLHR